jgi:hypothetical protein
METERDNCGLRQVRGEGITQLKPLRCRVALCRVPSRSATLQENMIPPNIERKHIIEAILEIDRRKGTRPSRKFDLIYNGNSYPPKYVLSLANKYANGEELRSSKFNGGKQTNRFLEARGFTIKERPAFKQCPASPPLILARPQERKKQKQKHGERCRECKDVVEQLLRKLYGRVERNYRLEVGAKLNDYKSHPFYETLREILAALEAHRNFGDFIRTPSLSSVDFFVPDPGFILEVDESQHFSECRKLTLKKYPTSLQTGFDRNVWIKLCEELQAWDNSPQFRDEQRAWYDTLRDFLPITRELKPTIRLYAAARRWCDLDPSASKDIETFKAILEGRNDPARSPSLEMKCDPHPKLGRIIIDGNWSGDMQAARELLLRICEAWPVGEYLECLITPGAFITFGTDSLPKVKDNINVPSETVELLFSQVRSVCRQFLTDELAKRLSGCARYLTLGIDSQKRLISQTQNYIRERHVEMVCLADLVTGDLHMTGKSYPTLGQEHSLIRIPDLESHFLDLQCGSVMVLGCHDLSMFNPRGRSVAGKWRKKVSNNFLELARKRRPAIVLHHPHTTIKTTTWIHATNTLKNDLPSVTNFLSAGRYSQDDAGWSKRDPLDNVLRETKMGDTLDIIAHTDSEGY